MRRSLVLSGISSICTSALAFAFGVQGDPQAEARKHLEPRPVTFSKPALPFDQAVAELTRGTGNIIADARRDKRSPDVQLPAGPVTFWPALDAMGKASGIGFSPSGPDGRMAWIDAPYRPVATAYGGLFRFAVRRVTVSREDETGVRQCLLAFDVAWEPRFQPFYADFQKVRLAFAPDAQGKQLKDDVPARGKVSVAGRSGIELEVRGAAPDRSCPRIESVQGAFWAIGPSKMLTFTFDKLSVSKPGAKPLAEMTHEGVSVRIVSIRRQTEALLVKLRIENPKDSPFFESHQSWLDNNRLRLVQEAAGKKRVLTPSESQEDRQGRHAEVEYAFTETGGASVPASLQGWTLHYETPGRIVEVTAPFVVRDLALP